MTQAAAGGPSSAPARALGAATLGLALLAILGELRRARGASVRGDARRARPSAGQPLARRREQSHMQDSRLPPSVPPSGVRSSMARPPGSPVSRVLPWRSCPQAGTEPGSPPKADNGESAAAARPDPVARALHASAALLAASVLADSALEHYRGGFENPGMFAPFASAAVALAAGAAAANGRPALARAGAYSSALAVGLAGTAFHAYNVTRRPGGLSWANLFYAAPLGAPAALALSGLFGQAARRVQFGAPRLAGMPAGRALCVLTGVGLAGTSAEAALLHFRGAYHNRAMWLPVTVPPMAAALVGAAAFSPPSAGPRRVARSWLSLTALLGLAGTALHARGIARQMGGWRNWSQNLLSGPPLPAPPSFAALALAGRGALALLDREAA